MTDDNGTVLVTGATGNTGSAILQAVASAGRPARAMVRSAKSADRLPDGTDVVVGDFDDLASIDRALDGVRRAYLVTPSSERAEQQQIDFADRAKAAGVDQLVVLSQWAARADSPVRFLRYHAAVEDHIRAIGLGYTFLRPNLYFQGLLALAPWIAATNTLSAPIGEAVVSAVDVRDIADVASAALIEDGHAGQTYDLTGPAAISHAQMAEELAAATGRPITFTDVTPEKFRGALQAALPPWQVDGTLEDYAHYARGEAATVSDDIPRVTGHPARSFAQFSNDYAAAFVPQQT